MHALRLTRPCLREALQEALRGGVFGVGRGGGGSAVAGDRGAKTAIAVGHVEGVAIKRVLALAYLHSRMGTLAPRQFLDDLRFIDSVFVRLLHGVSATAPRPSVA